MDKIRGMEKENKEEVKVSPFKEIEDIQHEAAETDAGMPSADGNGAIRTSGESAENGAEELSVFCGGIDVLDGMAKDRQVRFEPRTRYWIAAGPTGLQLTGASHPGCFASLYYREDLNEYVIAPMTLRQICLESGQWIGTKGEYYLPAGMKIFFPNFGAAWQLMQPAENTLAEDLPE